MSHTVPKDWRFAAVAAGIAVVLTLATYAPVLGYGFTDVDALMDVTEAKLDHADDLFRIVSQPHTGGRAGATANFYRPVTGLVYAAVRSVSGWNPFGYHALALFLHAACGLLIALVVRRLAIRSGLAHADALGWTTATIHVLHPLGVEVVPAVARTGDLLVTFFGLAGLWMLDRAMPNSNAHQPLPTTLARLVPFWVLLLVAIASKEAGVLWLGAAALWILLAGAKAPPTARVRSLAVVLVPSLALTAGFLAIRSAVIGDASGGYHFDTPFPTAAVMIAQGLALETTLPAFARSLAVYLPHFGRFSVTEGLWATAGVAMSGGGLLLVRSELAASVDTLSWRDRWRSISARPDVRVASFGILVILGYAALLLATRTYERRLLYPILPFWSLLAALVCGWIRRGLGSGQLSRTRRVAIAAAASVCLFAFVSQSPLVRRDIEWRSSGDATRLATVGLETRWASLPEGSRVDIANLPTHFSFDPARRNLFIANSSSLGPDGYSIQAWLDDALPGRKICVRPISLHLYQAPLTSYRAEPRLDKGAVVFRTPPIAPEHPFDVPLADARPATGLCGGVDAGDYQMTRTAGGWTRLVFTGSRADARNRFALVLDRESPRMIPVKDLRTER